MVSNLRHTRLSGTLQNFSRSSHSSIQSNMSSPSNSVNVTMSFEDFENFRKWQGGQAAEQTAKPSAKQAAKQPVKDNYLGPQLTIKYTSHHFSQIILDLRKYGILVCGIVSVPKFRSITLTIDYENATPPQVEKLKSIIKKCLDRETIRFNSSKPGEYYQPRILHGQECYARRFLGIEEPSEPTHKGKPASEPTHKGNPASKPTHKGKPASKPSPKGKPASKPLLPENLHCEDRRLYLTIVEGKLEDQAKRFQGEHPDIFSGYQFTKKGDKIKMLLREDVDPSKLKSFLDDGNTSLIPKEKEGQINAILSKAKSEDEPKDEPEDESEDESEDEPEDEQPRNGQRFQRRRPMPDWSAESDDEEDDEEDAED